MLEGARADAPFAWDGCARHRRSVRSRGPNHAAMHVNCHAHAPHGHAHDSAQRRFAQGCQERSWRHILRDGMRSASVECVYSEVDCATGHACQRARDPRRDGGDAASRERSESARQLDLSHGAYRAPMREVVLSVALGARNVCPRPHYHVSDMYY